MIDKNLNSGGNLNMQKQDVFFIGAGFSKAISNSMYLGTQSGEKYLELSKKKFHGNSNSSHLINSLAQAYSSKLDQTLLKKKSF
ncbi:MAG: hypothetical protein OXB84_05880 [Halobacteriovoraceae bacterium]|nr:hypothetical protein [Halobacteriovoraceae bacterium]